MFYKTKIINILEVGSWKLEVGSWKLKLKISHEIDELPFIKRKY